MKSLSKILLLAGLLGYPLFSGDGGKEEQKASTSGFLSVGLHSISNDELSNAYGGMPRVCAGFSSNPSSTIRIGGSIGLTGESIKINKVSTSGEYRINQDQQNTLSLIDVSAWVDYLAPSKEGNNFYVGAGLIFVNMKEYAKGTAYIDKLVTTSYGYKFYDRQENRPINDEISVSKPGAFMHAGYEIGLSEDTKMLLEISNSMVSEDLGGLSLSAGIRKEF